MTAQITRHGPRRLSALLVATLVFLPATALADLDTSQRQALQNEARAAFQEGRRIGGTDLAVSKQAYTRAADKYALLAAAGCDGGALQARLGEASLRAGRPGQAIAALTRAQAILGATPQRETLLAQARALRDNDDTPPATATTWVKTAETWNRRVSLTSRIWIGLVGWLGFWAMVTWGLFRRRPKPTRDTRRRAYRMAMWAMLIIALLAGASAAWDFTSEADATRGVILADGPTLRAGKNIAFEAVTPAPLKDGQEFTLLEQRGDWLYVQLDDGPAGWIPANSAACFPPAKQDWLARR